MMTLGPNRGRKKVSVPNALSTLGTIAAIGWLSGGWAACTVGRTPEPTNPLRKVMIYWAITGSKGGRHVVSACASSSGPTCWRRRMLTIGTCQRNMSNEADRRVEEEWSWWFEHVQRSWLTCLQHCFKLRVTLGIDNLYQLGLYYN